MAKGAYIGVGGVAKKIKKMYIGVGGVARKIKKVYIGVNGVARLCWSGESSYRFLSFYNKNVVGSTSPVPTTMSTVCANPSTDTYNLQFNTSSRLFVSNPNTNSYVRTIYVMGESANVFTAVSCAQYQRYYAFTPGYTLLSENEDGSYLIADQANQKIKKMTVSSSSVSFTDISNAMTYSWQSVSAASNPRYIGDYLVMMIMTEDASRHIIYKSKTAAVSAAWTDVSLGVDDGYSTTQVWDYPSMFYKDGYYFFSCRYSSSTGGVLIRRNTSPAYAGGSNFGKITSTLSHSRNFVNKDGLMFFASGSYKISYLDTAEGSTSNPNLSEHVVIDAGSTSTTSGWRYFNDETRHYFVYMNSRNNTKLYYSENLKGPYTVTTISMNCDRYFTSAAK